MVCVVRKPSQVSTFTSKAAAVIVVLSLGVRRRTIGMPPPFFESPSYRSLVSRPVYPGPVLNPRNDLFSVKLSHEAAVAEIVVVILFSLSSCSQCVFLLRLSLVRLCADCVCVSIDYFWRSWLYYRLTTSNQTRRWGVFSFFLSFLFRKLPSVRSSSSLNFSRLFFTCIFVCVCLRFWCCCFSIWTDVGCYWPEPPPPIATVQSVSERRRHHPSFSIPRTGPPSFPCNVLLQTLRSTPPLPQLTREPMLRAQHHGDPIVMIYCSIANWHRRWF